MNPSYPYDPELHPAGSEAARNRCSFHLQDGESGESCEGEPVVSFQDGDGQWQSGCARALRQLVDRGEIEPLGQGA
jgi:hypothetical protein